MPVLQFLGAAPHQVCANCRIGPGNTVESSGRDAHLGRPHQPPSSETLGRKASINGSLHCSRFLENKMKQKGGDRHSVVESDAIRRPLAAAS